MRTVDRLRPEHQLGEWQFEQGADLGAGPVVAEVGGGLRTRCGFSDQ